MFRQPPSPDYQWLQEQRTPQPNSTGQIRSDLNNAISEVSCFLVFFFFFLFTLPLQQCNSRQGFEWKICAKTVFYELKEFNVYFTDTEQSFCFIYLLWIAASQCQGTSFSERLMMFRTFQNQISFFFLSNKNISLCFNTLSDELNMQTSRLPRRLMDYITYGFFESNKNKANQKVHPTQKKKNSIPVCDQRYCLC